MCKPTKAGTTAASTRNGASMSSSPVASGVGRCQYHILAGLLLHFSIYGIAYWANLPLKAQGDHCLQAQDGEEEERNCSRPDLVAYKITSVLSMAWMGVLGFKNWYFGKEVRKAGQSRPEARLFGYLQAADAQSVSIFVYQTWDFCVSLAIPEFVDPIFLTHHVLAGACAWLSLHLQMFSYYSVYFGGCAEISSIFLALADMDDIFTGLPFALEVAVLSSKGLFTLTFTYYRVITWMKWSKSLWQDSLSTLQSRSIEKLRPGKTSFVYVFLGLNVVLGVLQVYWFGLIVHKVIEMILS